MRRTAAKREVDLNRCGSDLSGIDTVRVESGEPHDLDASCRSKRLVFRTLVEAGPVIGEDDCACLVSEAEAQHITGTDHIASETRHCGILGRGEPPAQRLSAQEWLDSCL